METESVQLASKTILEKERKGEMVSINFSRCEKSMCPVLKLNDSTPLTVRQ
jgi:hypothetical protein